MTDVEIFLEEPRDAEAISVLYDRAFGPGRFTRTAYRIREGRKFQTELSLAARSKSNGSVTGTLRFSAISIGGKRGALLLGPLAVDPASVGEGTGRALVKEGLSRVCSKGHRLVVLVGDLDYYKPLGFVQTHPWQLLFPGPVDPMRVLAYECQEGVLENYSGLVIAI